MPDPGDRVGLLVVNSFFAGLAFPGRDASNIFEGSKVLDKVIATAIRKSPALQQQAKVALRRQWRREDALATLNARFRGVPAECAAAIEEVYDAERLKALQRFAVTCPDVAAFLAALTPGA